MALLYPYKPGSNSGRELAKSLEIKRISHRNSKFRGRPEKSVINWGASKVPEEVGKCTLINSPTAVARAADKLVFFENADCRVPIWTTDYDVARDLMEEEGVVIVERHILNGHSGAGIEIVDDAEDLDEDCPLYVQYVPKKHEYRVHVFRGQVIDVQRKARKREVPDEQVNWKVRNNANGFVFARNGDALGDVPPDVLEQATSAVASLGLDFGAADVIFNNRSQLAYVLEVNTAPGLEGTTLANYTEAFREFV